MSLRRCLVGVIAIAGLDGDVELCALGRHIEKQPAVIDLDDPGTLAAVDPQDALGAVERMPEQWLEAVTRARSCDGLSVTNAIPVFGAFTNPLIDSPGNATEFDTPGCSSASVVICLMTRSDRSSVAASGSCANATR